MKSTNIYNMVLIAIMAAVLCVISPFSLPIGPVPISLATLAIYVIIFILGWKKSTISVLVFLVIGLVGVPVFSGFSGGVGKVFGPTGGYLIGYLLLTIVAGLFIEKFEGKYYMYVIGLVLGTICLYALGTLWLAYQAGMSLYAALGAGVIPFIPGDIVKIVVACILGPVIAKQIKKLQPETAKTLDNQ